VKKTISIGAGALCAAATLWSGSANAFCGFYVAKADTKLFNKASQVAIVHDDDKNVLTMSNDFQGDLKEFAIVIPVPTALEKDQIHVGERVLLDRLDAYSSPRLVEYWDNNPCQVSYDNRRAMAPMPSAKMSGAGRGDMQERAKSLGVTIEAQYTIGEYDISILSAKQSDGLETFLTEQGYKIPKGANGILGSYIKQGMHFFIAKVNLAEQAKTGFTYLRPLQVAYQSPKFMLPIRLGTVNADGPQELFIYMLTRKGRVETTNYKTVKLPTGQNVPEYVKDDFGPFYKAMFGTQVKKNDMHAVFTEYAWDMGSCDPCAADPLTPEEQRKLGVFWQNDGGGVSPGGPMPRGGMRRPMPYGGSNAFLTRLHVRYDADHFPEDLVFQETSDRGSFQGRYVMQHMYKAGGDESCAAMPAYLKGVHERHEVEAKTLAELTGWEASDIRSKMKLDDEAKDFDTRSKPKDDKGWYKDLWK
jgi:hypothetical protein